MNKHVIFSYVNTLRLNGYGFLLPFITLIRFSWTLFFCFICHWSPANYTPRFAGNFGVRFLHERTIGTKDRQFGRLKIGGGAIDHRSFRSVNGRAIRILAKTFRYESFQRPVVFFTRTENRGPFGRPSRALFDSLRFLISVHVRRPSFAGFPPLSSRRRVFVPRSFVRATKTILHGC